MKTPDLDIMLGEYLQVRRSLGFKLKRVESQLRGFVAFLKQQNASRINWNEGLIRIGSAKFLKSRLVPVHPTTLEALRAYARERERFFAARKRCSQPCFFVTRTGRALTPRQTCFDFHKLLWRAGLRKPGERRGPRLHDLRHRFAIVTLLRHQESGKDAGNVMPVLATYLGHSHARHTYWYLSSTPDLMAAAKERLEKRREGGAQ
jgi:integrase